MGRDNKNDKFAVAIIHNNLTSEQVFDKFSDNLSEAMSRFLSLPNTNISVHVIGKRVNQRAEFSLEITVNYTFYNHIKNQQ